MDYAGSSRQKQFRNQENLDRFIPNRSAMDFDYAKSMLTTRFSWNFKDKPASSFPSREAYRKQLAEVLNMNRTRILEFKNKPSAPVELFSPNFNFSSLPQEEKPENPLRRRIPQKCDKKLDAPNLVDDYYLNLLDWGSSNVLAIALANEAYLWDPKTCSTRLETFENESCEPVTVTCVSWAPDGQLIAIGLDNSQVQLWDSTAKKKVRTFRGCPRFPVGSMAWNNHILTTGGMDGRIFNNDIRVRSHIVDKYRGHEEQVLGLKWSACGQKLASGGNDDLLYIWDRRSAASNSNSPSHHWLHRFEDHKAAVKALAWCPFKSNLLASGGGQADQCIKFWNTDTGACLNSVHTGSQVCALLWNNNERELLSSHGFPENQLTLWKYPSMGKIAHLTSHTSRVLYMAQSPDGCTVASAAGASDETLQFWNIFGVPGSAPKAFSHFDCIR